MDAMDYASIEPRDQDRAEFELFGKDKGLGGARHGTPCSKIFQKPAVPRNQAAVDRNRRVCSR